MEGILIPGFPNDVSLEILARVPRQYYSKSLAKVSSSWREAVKSPILFAVRKRLQTTESWLYTAVVCEQENRPCVLWFARNASSRDCSDWWALPLMPVEHKPIYGFRCAAVGELLFVLGGCEWQNGCTNFPATNKVSVYNARINSWSCVQGMRDGRANFACGVVDGKVFVAGGDRSVDVDDAENSDEDEVERNCLKSAETYNPLTDMWTPLSEMKHAKHFVNGCVIDGKFVVWGFVCEEDLQFCEITEVFEGAENKWVRVEGEADGEDSAMEGDGLKYEGHMMSWYSSHWQLELYGSNEMNREKEEEMKKQVYGGIPQASVVIKV